MSLAIDETHDPALTSWVAGADGHPDFPIQNLPLGVFSPPGKGPRGGIAIGEHILDLAALAMSPLLTGDARTAAQAAAGQFLNPLLALGSGSRRALRRGVSRLLSDPAERDSLLPMLHDAASATLHLPARIGDYTDFYVGIHHATNVGRLFRPDNPLLPNYKHVPIGYHGRASSTSNGDDFSQVNPLGYVPVVTVDDAQQDFLSETITIISHLADQHPEANLIPANGTLDRAKMNALLTFIATEIAQKHIPLMRKLLTEDGAAWTRAKLVVAYKALDDRLAKHDYVAGDSFSVADAYVWATMWHERSGAEIEHFENLFAWKNRIEARPSVIKALADEAAIVAAHQAKIAA